MRFKFVKTLLASCLAAAAVLPASAARPVELPDSFVLPDRAIVLNGHDGKTGHDLVALLYDAADLHFQDPSAPRFLLLDREGRIAFGIGGYVKGTVQYDFDGSIDDRALFKTYDIPVPGNPAQRNQFFANVDHSTIFMQLAGRTERFGYYQVYVRTNFTGGNGNYGLKLKQAWMSIGHIKAGLARSVFQDGAAGIATVDDQGPAGAIGKDNVAFQYTPVFSRRLRGAISIEMPSVSLTPVEGRSQAINQRVPDIPAYIQFDYGQSSHVRFSAIWRNLSYRDLVDGRNRFATGYGIQLSGVSKIVGGLSVRYQAAYGKGIASYFNDLGGQGCDLIPSDRPGRLRAPNVLGVVGALRYDFSPRVFISGGYSQMRLYDQASLGADAYRYGQYVVANCFWTAIPELQLGLEYLYGSRNNFDGRRGTANRIEAMVQYSF